MQIMWLTIHLAENVNVPQPTVSDGSPDLLGRPQDCK